MNLPTSCPECGSTAIEWELGVEQSRINDNFHHPVFWIGCTECSETVAQVARSEVLEALNGLLAQPHTCRLDDVFGDTEIDDLREAIDYTVLGLGQYIMDRDLTPAEVGLIHARQDRLSAVGQRIRVHQMVRQTMAEMEAKR